MPDDLPPRDAAYWQAQRWLTLGYFEQLADDLWTLLHLASGRSSKPSAAIFYSQTLHASPESGEQAWFDGAKRRKGSKVQLAVDTLGHLLTVHLTPNKAEDRF